MKSRLCDNKNATVLDELVHCNLQLQLIQLIGEGSVVIEKDTRKRRLVWLPAQSHQHTGPAASLLPSVPAPPLPTGMVIQKEPGVLAMSASISQEWRTSAVTYCLLHNPIYRRLCWLQMFLAPQNVIQSTEMDSTEPLRLCVLPYCHQSKTMESITHLSSSFII